MATPKRRFADCLWVVSAWAAVFVFIGLLLFGLLSIAPSGQVLSGEDLETTGQSF